jgi:hypothetical protein
MPGKRDTKGEGGKRAVRLYSLEVKLIDGPVAEAFAEKNPEMSRTIQMRGNQTLAQLHEAIFDAFDRDDEHMYEFQFGKEPMDPKARRYVLPMDSGYIFDEDRPAGLVTKTTIDSLRLKPKESFYYWFDFGDDWWHQITLLEFVEAPPKGVYPRVTHRVGRSPPQYPNVDE